MLLKLNKISGRTLEKPTSESLLLSSVVAWHVSLPQVSPFTKWANIFSNVPIQHRFDTALALFWLHSVIRPKQESNENNYTEGQTLWDGGFKQFNSSYQRLWKPVIFSCSPARRRLQRLVNDLESRDWCILPVVPFERDTNQCQPCITRLVLKLKGIVWHFQAMH